MEVLEDLLRIKIYREEKSEIALARARLHLLDMEKALDKARQALENHQRECGKKEKSMYEEICTRVVLVKEIDDLILDVKLMKEASVDLEKKIEKAKESRDQAAEAVEVSRQVHRDAVRMREKFLEMVQTVDAERAVEVLRLEDLELEEAAGSRHVSLSPRQTDFSNEEVGAA